MLCDHSSMAAWGYLRTIGTAILSVRVWWYSRRNQGESGLRRSNVGCWRVSGRTLDTAGTSLISQERSFRIQSGKPALRRASSMVAVFLSSGELLASTIHREIVNFGWRSMNR